MRAELRVKNYRCFSDEAPLVLPPGDEPVAVVVPNNSGKSTAIRLLHELQPLWSQLSQANPSILAGNPFGMSQLRDVTDNLDVFFDDNKRDIEIQLSLRATPDAQTEGGQVGSLNVRWERAGNVVASPTATSPNEGWISDKLNRRVEAR
jgi:hypothetical protein